MNLTREYYLRTYDELSILSNTEKCVTVLMRNRDTGELVVKKTMHKSSFEVYSKLKEIQHKNIVNVLECFEDGEHCIAVEEYINGKRIDYIRDKIDEWKWFELNQLPNHVYSPSKKFIDAYLKKNGGF